MSLPHNINVQARVSTLIDFKLLSVANWMISNYVLTTFNLDKIQLKLDIKPKEYIVQRFK